MSPQSADEGLTWQIGVWDRISDLYQKEIDQRFAPVVRGVVDRARLKAGERVLDLGAGTGAVAIEAARAVTRAGAVLAVDISPKMLEIARARAVAAGVGSISVREGRGEELPAEAGSFDAVLASLSVMYAIDRAAVAREVARVLRPGGRFVAAVWAGPERCDIVRFQQTAGKFAPKPPVAGVGPGALADPAGFLSQLSEAGLAARVETEDTFFEFAEFESAWTVLAGVTTAGLPADAVREAKAAVQEAMWPGGKGARRFRNATHFIVGERRT